MTHPRKFSLAPLIGKLDNAKFPNFQKNYDWELIFPKYKDFKQVQTQIPGPMVERSTPTNLNITKLFKSEKIFRPAMK
jgi:hypothetical protein